MKRGRRRRAFLHWHSLRGIYYKQLIKNTCLALLLPKKTRNPWARVLYARSVSYEPCCLDASSYSASASPTLSFPLNFCLSQISNPLSFRLSLNSNSECLSQSKQQPFEFPPESNLQPFEFPSQ